VLRVGVDECCGGQGLLADLGGVKSGEKRKEKENIVDDAGVRLTTTATTIFGRQLDRFSLSSLSHVYQQSIILSYK